MFHGVILNFGIFCFLLMLLNLFIYFLRLCLCAPSQGVPFLRRMRELWSAVKAATSEIPADASGRFDLNGCTKTDVFFLV